MYRKIAEIYRGELPFVIPPLVLLVASVLILRFAVVPQFVRVTELRNVQNSQTALLEEKRKLLARLHEASQSMAPIPHYPKLTIGDESALIQLLLKSARTAGVTLSQTAPSRDASSFVVQTAFSASWNSANWFLRELEKFPTTISVMPVAFSRRGSLIDVTLTIRTIPAGGTQ